jgi:ERO1-like protein alpha
MRFVYNNLLLFWASLGVAYDPFNEAVERDRSLRRVDQCFCELQGPVDVCCCDVETVDTLNSEKIYPLISSLVEFPFFKFYQVNLNQPCPFWPDDSTCMTKLCDVQECEETEIPVTLKLCDQEQEENLRLSYVNSTVSTQQREDFMKWEKHDDSEESFCESDADSADGMIYVDLLLNPERFTGYSGASAHRVWNSIYKENCFRPETESSVVLPFESSLVQGKLRGVQLCIGRIK